MQGTVQLETALLNSLSDLALVARSVVEGFLSGLHRSPFLGYSSEFASYRPYIQGDDLRYVDWKVWGRTDGLFVKQFEDDTNVQGQILLDASGSMDFGTPHKFAYARLLAAALAHLMNRQNDAPGLVLFGGNKLQALPGGRHKSGLDEMLLLLARCRPSGQTLAGLELMALVQTFSRRGIAVVISDGFSTGEGLVDLLRQLRAQRQEVIFFHLLAPEELDFPVSGQVLMEEIETGEVIPVHAGAVRENYLRRLESFCTGLSGACEQLEVEYRRLRTDLPIERALAFYLEERMAR